MPCGSPFRAPREGLMHARRRRRLERADRLTRGHVDLRSCVAGLAVMEPGGGGEEHHMARRSPFAKIPRAGTG